MGVTTGSIYIGQLELKYDASGATLLKFSNGEQRIWWPNFHDVSQLVQAHACGYGRQVGLMQFHTIVMHCLMADNEFMEPEWLRGQDPDYNRINHAMYLLAILNNQRTDAQPDPDDMNLVNLARFMLHGEG